LPPAAVEIDGQKMTFARWQQWVYPNDESPVEVVEEHMVAQWDKFTMSAVSALGPGFLTYSIDPLVLAGGTVTAATFRVLPHLREYVPPAMEECGEERNVAG
jgi:hypothetical protein